MAMEGCLQRSFGRGLSLIKAILVVLLAVLAGSPALTRALNPQHFQPELPIVPPRIPHADPASTSGRHHFSLRYIFHRGTYKNPRLHKKLTIRPETRLWVISEDTGLPEPISEPATPLVALSNPVTIQRLVDRRLSVIENHLSLARSTGSAAILSPSAWVMDELDGPNITDKHTVLSFAKMTANDYVEEPGTEDWEDISGPFNYSQSFGWQSDGLRGHIYANDDNSTVVISLKGTSPAVFDGAGTTTNDKINDNLYFSCCCGQGGSYLWRQVCDCYQSAYTGNLTCIVEAMLDENRYYRSSIELYSNVTKVYPEANVWLTGHSLGGAMSGLLGLTFGLPVVTFEAIPEALPAARLGIPVPPGHDPRRPQTRKHTGSYHFGHTADPVYMGTCNGATSVCTWGGYAMESACHTGQVCAFDTVDDKGWSMGIGTHRIKSVISDVLEVYDHPAPCAPEVECYDCQLWKFFKGNDSEIPTTSTPTSTKTSTCKTPGWWGCLDETTTTTTAAATSTTTESSTTSTSTCKTPGWFGCKDPTTTTTATATPGPSLTITSAPTSTSCQSPGLSNCPNLTSTTSTSSASDSPSSTCKTPGIIWGCHDKITSSNDLITSAPPTSSTCKTPGIIWGCRDETTSSNGHLITSALPPLSTCNTPGIFWGCRDSTCKTRGIFWGCQDKITSSSGHLITSPPPQPSGTSGPPPKKQTCTSRGWFGLICLDPRWA
ncbi:hypothetical protein Egran_05888 [Elaphomyces granulatus]|uniref:Putative lipase ATG15 n=1 Tax=Elaphomyces granulatus TaxID=519963 RepID=A0A232LQA5_9EURO|nr:hypothetical protein Egran_05888 [Elaphomyces granulatus]